MNINKFSDHFLQSLSWMLLHSLWEGLLVAVLTGILLIFSTRMSAAFRYRVIHLHFILFLMAVISTFIYEWNLSVGSFAETKLFHSGRSTSFDHPYFNTGELQDFFYLISKFLTQNTILIVGTWALLFIWQLVKLAGNIISLQRVRSKNHYEPEVYWIEKTKLLCKQLGIQRPVALMESAYINFPVVLGHLKPLILIPAGVLSGLPPAQIEAVLLHELAHVKRNDYLTNLLQAITEAIFFFNPGLLWISSLLRDEREHCCDDIALAQTGNKKEFIQALINFKEYASDDSAGYAMTFPGKKNQLLNRVKRIINNRHKPLLAIEKFALLSIILLFTALISFSTVIHTDSQIAKGITNTNKTMFEKASYTVRRKIETLLKETTLELLANNVRIRETIQPQEVIAYNQIAADQRQAIEDQALVVKYKAEAMKARDETLRMVAERDRDLAQAIKDREQASLDTEQAVNDRVQATRDRASSVRDMEQAKMDLQQAAADRKTADDDREKTIAEKRKAEHGRAQATVTTTE